MKEQQKNVVNYILGGLRARHNYYLDVVRIQIVERFLQGYFIFSSRIV